MGSTLEAKASAAFRFVATPFACASRRLVRFGRMILLARGVGDTRDGVPSAIQGRAERRAVSESARIAG